MAFVKLGVKSSIVGVNMDFGIAENGMTAFIAIRCAHGATVTVGNMHTVDRHMPYLPPKISRCTVILHYYSS